MNGVYKNFIENTDAYLTLYGDYSRGKLSHAYLLNAPDRLAGKLVMEQFASAVLGHMSSVDANRIPANGREGVLVCDIDDIVSDLPKRPSRGEYKFYLIDCAETMSAQCQNKLLKTLEEPQPGVCLVLNARGTHKILPTILSRCKVSEIRFFSEPELYSALSGVYGGDDKVRLAVALSGGKLEEADACMQDEKRFDRFRLALDILTNTKTSKDVLLAVTRLGNFKDKEKERLAEIINNFELILRDVAVYHTGQTGMLILKGFEAEIAALSGLYTQNAALAILPFLNKVRKRQQFNANLNSLLDELMFKIVQIRAANKQA